MTTTILAQDPVVWNTCSGAVQAERCLPVTLAPITAPSNAHEMALSIFADYAAYQKVKTAKLRAAFSDNEGMTITGAFDAKELIRYSYQLADSSLQSFSVGYDGKVEYDHLTPEDALLMVEANTLQMRMLEEREQDREDARREAAKRTDVPPKILRYQGQIFKIDHMTEDWSGGLAAADTNCFIGRIRVLATLPDKRETVMHELMHVATHCNENPSLHHSISAISPGLVKLMRENPALVDYLMKGAKGWKPAWPGVFVASPTPDDEGAWTGKIEEGK